MSAPDGYEVRPIGWVRSPLTDRAGAPRQGDEGAPAADIVLDQPMAAGAVGLRPGAEVLVLTWLHLADRAVLAVHPRGDRTRPVSGVFATRSPDRPNPIGLHRVTIAAIDGCAVTVHGLEAITAHRCWISSPYSVRPPSDERPETPPVPGAGLSTRRRR